MSLRESSSQAAVRPAGPAPMMVAVLGSLMGQGDEGGFGGEAYDGPSLSGGRVVTVGAGKDPRAGEGMRVPRLLGAAASAHVERAAPATGAAGRPHVGGTGQHVAGPARDRQELVFRVVRAAGVRL